GCRFWSGLSTVPVQSAINLRDLCSQILDAIEQTLFHVTDCQHHSINVVPRGCLYFIAELCHEVVAHPPEVDRRIHPLFHALQKLRRAHELLPRLRERLEHTAADLLEDIRWRRIVAERKSRLHHFRHRFHPDFLEGRHLLRSFFKVV